MKLHDFIWLVPLFPLAGAVFNGLVSNRRGLSKSVTHTVALLGSGLAWLYAWAAVVQWFLTEDRTAPYVVRAFEWISGGALTIADGSSAELEIAASFQGDPLSATMLGFVTFVGFLIHLYSVGYMHGEPDRAYARYFAYLNLFMFSMLTLITGSNLPVLFVGWEGVGLCSYLLIGFWYDKMFTPWRTVTVRTSRPRRPSSGCCSSSAPSASRRRFRSMSGCPTPWPARPRCRR